jgi:hypothetical protein
MIILPSLHPVTIWIVNRDVRFGPISFFFFRSSGFTRGFQFLIEFISLISEYYFSFLLPAWTHAPIVLANVSDRPAQKRDRYDGDDRSSTMRDRSFSSPFKKLHYSKVHGIEIRHSMPTNVRISDDRADPPIEISEDIQSAHRATIGTINFSLAIRTDTHTNKLFKIAKCKPERFQSIYGHADKMT